MAENPSQPVRRTDIESESSLGLQALIKCLKIGFVVMAILIIGMVIWFLTFGGYFAVPPQEAVIVLTFGKVHDSNIYAKGWGWAMPYPVNKVIRIPTNSQRLITSAFMPLRKNQAFKSEEEQPTGPLEPGKDGYLLTGDANILHSQWELIYQVTDPKKYYLTCLCPNDPREDDEVFTHAKVKTEQGSRGPQTLLRTLLESTILEVTARVKVEDALYRETKKYERLVRDQFQHKVDQLDLGVTIDDVLLRGKNPPARTKRAFQEVFTADVESFKVKDEARAYATETKQNAASECAKLLTDAHSYQKRVVSEVKSESVYFEQILVEYEKNPTTVLVALYNQTLADVLGKVKDKYIISKHTGSQELRLKLNPEVKLKRDAETGKKAKH